MREGKKRTSWHGSRASTWSRRPPRQIVETRERRERERRKEGDAEKVQKGTLALTEWIKDGRERRRE
jgi:hypothetical protein